MNNYFFVYVMEGGIAFIDTKLKAYKCIGVRESFDEATELVDEYALPFSTVNWTDERSNANKIINVLHKKKYTAPHCKTN